MNDDEGFYTNSVSNESQCSSFQAAFRRRGAQFSGIALV